MARLYDTGIFSVNGTDGSVGVGYKLNFYTTGTSTRKDTYPTRADAIAGTNANANPVVAAADGRWAPIWLTGGDYKVILTDFDDVVLETRDPGESGADIDSLEDSIDAVERRAYRNVHHPFAYDYSTSTIVVRDGTADAYHRHFGGIAEGIDGRLHLVYRREVEHALTSGGTLYYTYSDDGGKIWSAETILVAAIAGFDQRSVSMCVTPTGRIVVIYDKVVVPSAAPTVLRMVYSDDNGATWTQGTDIATINFAYARAYGRIKLIPGDADSTYRLAFTPYYQSSSTPTYRVPVWLSEDDGLTWAEGQEIVDNATGYSETELVAINSLTWLAVSRSTAGLNLWKTTDAGATWSSVGTVSLTSSDSQVAPSLDKFKRNGKWYVVLGYCNRTGSTDEMVWRVGEVSELLSSASAFCGSIATSTDMQNASGYQSPVTDRDGNLYVDGGTAFVEFKEYTGQDYSQVRFVRMDLPALAIAAHRSLTVASGAITVPDTFFDVTVFVGTEGGAGTDDLDTINGGREGQVMIFESPSGSTDTTFKHLTGNISLRNSRDFKLFTAGDTGSRIALCKSGTRWYEIVRSEDSTNTFHADSTWTPVPYGTSTAGSPTGTFAGSYIKIGRQVFITCQIVFTGLDTMAGNVEISGLPFTATSGSSNRSSISVGFRNNFTNDFAVGGYVLENSTTIRLHRMDQDNVALAVADLAATTNLYFTATYISAT